MLWDQKKDKNLSLVPASEPWRDLLLDAADLIDERGLAKKAYDGPQGELCPLAAINEAGRIKGYDEEAHTLAGLKLRDHVDAYSVPNWSDKPETTKERVVATMRSAATEPR